MAKAKSSATPSEPTPEAVSLDRIAKTLALLVIKDRTGADATVLLNQIGFGNQEISDLLQTTTAVVAQRLYEHRKAPKRRPKKPE